MAAKVVHAVTWLKYMSHKLDYAVCLSAKSYWEGKILENQVGDVVWKNLFQEKLTYTYTNLNKCDEMALFGPNRVTLLVRKIPKPDHSHVLMGDVVVLRDPTDSDNYLVRRLAAVGGDRMISYNFEEENFHLENDQCWVVSDKHKSEEPFDSRSFGPVPMSSIVGRAIYYMRELADHGRIGNNELSYLKDSPVVSFEMDLEELSKNHKE